MNENLIEIRRGLFWICHEPLMDVIASLECCEQFYQDIFSTFGVLFNNKTIREKRVFVASITKYFIIDRLPMGSIQFWGKKYDIACEGIDICDYIQQVIDDYYEIYNKSKSTEEFMKKYATTYHLEQKDFIKDIQQSRNDTLSDFTRVMDKLVNPSGPLV
jgi:hypothetical protein